MLSAIQDKFKDDDGNFDNVAFEEVYKIAQNKYQNLSKWREYNKDWHC